MEQAVKAHAPNLPNMPNLPAASQEMQACASTFASGGTPAAPVNGACQKSGWTKCTMSATASVAGAELCYSSVCEKAYRKQAESTGVSFSCKGTATDDTKDAGKDEGKDTSKDDGKGEGKGDGKGEGKGNGKNDKSNARSSHAGLLGVVSALVYLCL